MGQKKESYVELYRVGFTDQMSILSADQQCCSIEESIETNQRKITY